MRKTTTTGDNLDTASELRYLSSDQINVHIDGKDATLTGIEVVKQTDDEGNTVTTTDLFFTTEAEIPQENATLNL